MSLEEMGEMLKSYGVEVEMNPISKPEARAEFTALASDASLPSAKLLRLTGKLKDGGRLHALLILS